MEDTLSTPKRVPKYLAVKRTLLDRISSRVYTDRLPTEAELGVELGVSPLTVRRALQELVGHGLIVRSRGRGNGTFLRAGVPVSASHQDSAQRLTRVGMLHGRNWNDLRSAPVHFQTFTDLQGECARQGVALEFVAAEPGVSAAELVRLARKSGCQALIALDWDAATLMKAQELGIPVIVAGSFLETTPVSYVEPNDCQGAYAATRHLVELGHPAVGLVENRAVGRASMGRRLGWQMAVQAKDADLVRLVYQVGRPTVEPSVAKFGAVKAELVAQFRQRRPPSALFARDGLFAYLAIQALAELGLKCPEDVSVTCVGRYYEGALHMPRMTSAQIEEGSMGRELVRLAEDLAFGRRTGSVGVVLPMHMVEGDTARPAGRQKAPKSSDIQSP